jgi:GNAT superfamily N-acetyltransferase
MDAGLGAGVPVRSITTEADLRRCHAVVRQLRPHLTEEDFVARVRDQHAEGYRVAAVEDEGRIVAFAGYRFLKMLHLPGPGGMLYVDDLVTDEAARSRGKGRELFAWLVDEARRHGCETVELESGVHRAGAHRFYFQQGMHIPSYHFRVFLQRENPRVIGAPAGRA